jgi:hypothetical protein
LDFAVRKREINKIEGDQEEIMQDLTRLKRKRYYISQILDVM